MNKTMPILLLVVLFGVAAWYFFFKEADLVHELPPSLLPPIEIVEVEKPDLYIEDSVDEVKIEVMEITPPMPEEPPKDETIRQALADIIGPSAALEYIVKDQLISRLVSTIDSLPSRQVPSLINPIKPVGGTLNIESEGDRTLMSGDNYSRYDGYITLLQNTDADDDKFQIDIDYVKRLSFWLDVKIILKTIQKVFKSEDIVLAPDVDPGIDEVRKKRVDS